MVDLELLREKVVDRGITITAISKKTGVSRETFYNRMNGKGDFTASEIVALTDALYLTKLERDKIFLNTKLNEMQLRVEEENKP